jgi:c-di-GMP-related signal transduction protein
MGVDSATAHRVVVARQPITDRHGDVVGFELLYRARRPDATALTGEHMTAQVVLGALSIGVDRLVGRARIFCNADRGVLVGETPLTLPPSRTVIEVLETVVIDDDVVAGCRALVEAGFTLALDDFVWAPGVERLLELADIVKIDLLAVPADELPALVERCRAYDVVLLAEKVETADDVERAMALGFDLFQGYAIERPAVVSGRSVAASATAHLQLAVTMLADDLDFAEVEEILRREPGLVLQLLQMASAGAHFGLRGQVRTVREALVLLGTSRIRRWVALTILGAQPEQSPDALAVALVRARMAEQVAPARGLADTEFAFTVGLMSALDRLLGVDRHQLAATMDLDDALKAAAFHRLGPVGALVSEIADYQDLVSGHPDDRMGEPAPDLDAAAAEAFAWAVPLVSGLDLP